MITPEHTVITDSNHIALYNQNVTGLQGIVVSTQSDYGYDLGLEEGTTKLYKAKVAHPVGHYHAKACFREAEIAFENVTKCLYCEL